MSYFQESGLYYLQSRYYNPEVGRFLNADSYTSTGQGLVGNNMFAYCLNNPILNTDITGSYAASIRINACTLQVDGAGGGGGAAIASVYLLSTILDIASNSRSWFDNQEKAITDKLATSLSRATMREYRTEYEEHHLVARRSANAAQAAAILNNVLPGGVEDPLNKVAVKTSVHRRIHTKLYYTLANHYVISAYLQGGTDSQQQYYNVVTALNALRIFVESLNILSIN